MYFSFFKQNRQIFCSRDRTISSHTGHRLGYTSCIRQAISFLNQPARPFVLLLLFLLSMSLLRDPLRPLFFLCVHLLNPLIQGGITLVLTNIVNHALYCLTTAQNRHTAPGPGNTRIQQIPVKQHPGARK